MRPVTKQSGSAKPDPALQLDTGGGSKTGLRKHEGV
jgi:hypothetical protein